VHLKLKLVQQLKLRFVQLKLKLKQLRLRPVELRLSTGPCNSG
jgi:hypothetical protein